MQITNHRFDEHIKTHIMSKYLLFIEEGYHAVWWGGGHLPRCIVRHENELSERTRRLLRIRRTMWASKVRPRPGSCLCNRLHTNGNNRSAPAKLNNSDSIRASDLEDTLV
ncbi:hypothetical protein J6590_035412 [Homalodisca vitripennis]|nr:hypothetical protein J6590_035412 [Homalodisca vitripennis]